MAKRLTSGGWRQKWNRDKNRASLVFNAALIVRVFVTVSVRRWSCEFQFPLQCDVDPASIRQCDDGDRASM